MGGRRVGAGTTAPLIGRSRELTALRALVADAAAGRGGVAIVEGEAGGGKTRLVTELLSALPPGATPVRGRCLEPERERPFAALLDALSAAGAPSHEAVTGAADAGPVDAPVGVAEPGLRFRVAEQLLADLERLAADAPLVLVLEDVQWADSATLLVVDRLIRRCARLPIAVIATCRPHPRSDMLAHLVDLADEHGAVRVPLERLSQADVHELVCALLAATPSPALLAHLERAGGNALFCVELVSVLREDGAISVTAGAAELGTAALPTTLRSLVLRRLRGLSDHTRHVLSVAAVLGAEFSLDDVSVVLAEPSSALLASLAEPLRAGVVGELGPSLCFRHALVRDAIYDDLPDDVRAALHRQVARAFAEAGRPASAVARHFLLGGRAPDAQAARWCKQAGREAASRAPDAAAELFEAALALGADDGPERDVLHAERGIALLWAGQVADGEASLRALLERPHAAAVDAPARMALAQALLIQARTAEAIAVLDEPGADQQASPGQRARMRADAALAHLVSADLAAADAAADAAEAAARDCGDAVALCAALSVRSAVLGLRGHPSAALALAEQAVEVAAASPEREASRRPPQLFSHGYLVELDRIDEAQKAVQTARRVSEDFGAVWDLPIVHLLTARGHVCAGDYADAEAEVEAGLAQAEEVGTTVLRVWAHAIMAYLQLQRGDMPAAAASLDAGDADLARYGIQVQGLDWLFWTRALYLEAQEAPDEALGLLRAVWEGLASYGVVSERRLIGADYVRLCVGAGAHTEARAVAEAVAETAALNGSRSAHAAALRCRGLATGDAGVLVDAVEAYRASPRRMEHGLTCEDAAAALARAGRDDEARVMLEEACAIFDAAGATRPAVRAEAALRALGVRRGARGSRSRTTSGWESLTATEVTISRLAAEGLTNPQIGAQLFISRRTVETHLSHVYAKLGLASRVELAAHVAARAQDPAAT